MLPQTQGARILYQDYVDPFLEHHEREIELFIGSAHERARDLGLQYFYHIVDLIREHVLGLPPHRPAPAPPTGPASYAQSLLSRFNLPTATSGQYAATDWLSSISSAVASMTSTGKSHEARAEELSASGTLFPREVASMSRADKARFISSQCDVLDVLRAALAKEQTTLGDEPGDEDLAYGAPLKKNESQNSFDRIEHEDVRDRSPVRGGGWTSGWFGGGQESRRR